MGANHSFINRYASLGGILGTVCGIGWARSVEKNNSEH